MPKNPEPDFPQIASRLFSTLGELGLSIPEMEGGDEQRRKYWIDATASILRAEQGYDDAAD